MPEPRKPTHVQVYYPCAVCKGTGERALPGVLMNCLACRGVGSTAEPMKFDEFVSMMRDAILGPTGL